MTCLTALVDPTVSDVNIDGAPSNGTAEVVEASQTIDYTPAAGFTGDDTFTYTVTVMGQISNPATVKVTVNPSPIPDAPIAANDSAATFQIHAGHDRCAGQRHHFRRPDSRPTRYWKWSINRSTAWRPQPWSATRSFTIRKTRRRKPSMYLPTRLRSTVCRRIPRWSSCASTKRRSDLLRWFRG